MPDLRCRPFRWMTCLALLTGLLLCAAPAYADGTVPNVLGKKRVDAQDAIEAANLVMKITYVNDPAHAEGIVISQKPAAGTAMLRGSTVRIQVNSLSGTRPPTGTVSVPQLVGRTYLTAVQMLKNVGLVPDATRIGRRWPGRASNVLSQSPAAGSRVAPGSQVAFEHSVSGGGVVPATDVIVPNFMGKTADEAKELAEDEGLFPLLAGPVGLSTARGVIDSQDLAAGTTVPRGTRIQLHYSGSSSPIIPGTRRGIVPDFIGMTLRQVEAAATSAGLSVRMVNIMRGTGVTPVATSQRTRAGTRLAFGTEVVVDFAPATRSGHGTVPNFFDMTPAQARAAATTANVLLAPLAVPSFIDPRVKTQSLPSGTRARGRAVNLTFHEGGLGPATVMPSVIGGSELRVDRYASGEGLRVVKSSTRDRPRAGVARVIVRQSPAPGTSLRGISVIRVTIGNDPSGGSTTYVTIPTWRSGESAFRYMGRLRRAGLDPQVSDISKVMSPPIGTTPRVGTSVPRGGRVVVLVR